MKKNYSISVAMATYNGEKYIKEQIDSILVNLRKNDELIISDDGSTDNTISIIKDFQKKDKRITLLNGPRLGVKQNFANSIKNCNGDYIFLSDQDDIWDGNKVREVMKAFKEDDILLVEHDCTLIDNEYHVINQSFFKYRKCGPGIIKNIYKNTYIGCCMAFKSNLKKNILPIPNNIEMHDQWIGLIAEKFGKVKFIEKKLIKYRRHGENTTSLKHYTLKKMLKNRVQIIRCLKNIKRDK
jgi:glycosyltransferase involved in cell wall biosynthesis